MGEFRSLAESIVRDIEKIASSEGLIGKKELQLITSDSMQEDFNLYPGTPSNKCCPFAVFIALSSSRLVRPRGGMIDFRTMLDCFVRHMNVDCKGKTHSAMIITDHWEVNAYEFWSSAINHIRERAQIEIYLKVMHLCRRIL